MSGMPMKLILTQEVTGLGEPGDVVEVKAGYGRNYLVPRGVAMQWTRGAEKQIELIRRARSAREIRSLADDKTARYELGRAGYAAAERLGGPDKMADRYLTMVQELTDVPLADLRLDGDSTFR